MIENKEKIIEWHRNSQSTAQIAKKLKKSPRTVRRILKGKLTRSHKFILNTGQLCNLDSEIGQYWAGYIKARGYISDNRSRLRCAVQHKDIGHLYQLAKDLHSNLQPKKNKYRAYLDINSRELIDLYRQITHIESNHFWRGYFDGSGIVTTCHGHLKMGLRNEQMRLLFSKFMKIENNRHWYGRTSIRLARLLYTGCMRHLSRKTMVILRFL